MRARKMVLSGLIMVLFLGLVGCGGDDEGDVLGNTKKNADLVLMDDDPFIDPKTLEIPLNREITFTVFNDGKDVHNVTIPGFEIDMDVQPKQSIDVKIPAISAPPRDGFYLLYCKFHQADGEAARINIAK